MNKEVRYKDRVLSGTQVIGYTANWTIIDGAGDLYPGRSFTEAEELNGDHVIIINDEMAKKLFGESDPLDKEITVAGSPFKVIGIYHYQASFLAGGNRPRAIVPFESAVRSLKASYADVGIAVVPRAGVTRDQAEDDVIAVMRARHALRPAAENDFALITQDQLLDTYNKIFGMFFLVMIVLSAVGLIVGGVGVVAIMMISVTERTREIGVRKALGATRGTILWQFLVEAVTLTGIGAIFGLIFGAIVVGNYSQCDTNSRIDPAARDCRGPRRERDHRRDVRHASGHARGKARSGRRAAIRVAGLRSQVSGLR